jgi:hypothetical protein
LGGALIFVYPDHDMEGSMMHRLVVLMLAVLLPGMAGSQSIGFNLGFAPRLQVNPLSATQFEVIESGGAGAQDIWCAAARHTEMVLGRTRGRLYVARARGPAQTMRGRTGIVFSTEPVTGAFTSVSVNVREAGMNLPIFHALQFCRNNILERED